MPTSLPMGDESTMNYEGMGIFFRNFYYFSKYFTTGALVYDARPGSLAEVAGFRAGDIIVAAVVTGPARGLEDLKDTLDQHQTGRRVYFAIWRHYFPEGWRKGSLNGRLGD